jgi:hypothetical protein
MKMACAVLLIALSSLAGCCHDPLTVYMNDMGLKPLVPAPQVAALGDVYRQSDIAPGSSASIIINNSKHRRLSDLGNLSQGFLDEFYDDTVGSWRDAIMARAAVAVTPLARAGSGAVYSVAEGSYAGAIAAKIGQSNVSKYSVTVENCTLYRFDDPLWCRTIPVLMRLNDNLEGQYAVTTLLHAGRLEYAFYDATEHFINVGTVSGANAVVQSQIGANWSVSESGTLVANNVFVGYQVSRLSTTASNVPGSRSTVVDPKYVKTVVKKQE